MATRLNRRVVLGAGVALTAAAPFTARAADTLPPIGMGTWRTFDVGRDRSLIRGRTEVLRTFFDMGGKVIDSSPMYGSSQFVLGQALDALDRPEMFSADKVWVTGGKNGPPQIEDSRRAWGVDRFDLLQVHNLRDWRDHLATLFEMKADGRVRYVGVTSYSGLRYDIIAQVMERHPLDFIQITYNIADREAENRLLPMARERGVRVIANRPFREGALIDAAMRRPLPDLASEIGADNWAQYLLKFIISHPAVTVAIPATRRVDHMRENMGAAFGAMPDAGLRARMADEFSAY